MYFFHVTIKQYVILAYTKANFVSFNYKFHTKYWNNSYAQDKIHNKTKTKIKEKKIIYSFNLGQSTDQKHPTPTRKNTQYSFSQNDNIGNYVAFSAVKTQNQDGVLRQDSVIVFEQTTINLGNDFNPNTGFYQLFLDHVLHLSK